MALVPKQARFSIALADLILTAKRVKLAVTIGEVQRTPEQAELYYEEGKGIADSVHLQKLAADLFLFDDCSFEPAPESAYENLAAYWISKSTLDDKRCWGGHFARKDIYHYSFEFDGRQ